MATFDLHKWQSELAAPRLNVLSTTKAVLKRRRSRTGIAYYSIDYCM